MKKFKLFKLLLLGVVLITSVQQMWGYGSAAGTVVYFDRQDQTGLFTGSVYLRRGNGGYNEACAMSLVGGTKYLYSYTMGAFEYEAISIANGYGWTGNNIIYQPHDGQYKDGKNLDGYSGGAIITQQTNYYKANISGNFYIKVGSADGSLSNNCQYYAFSHGTLPTYSISYNTPTNGTLTVKQYNGSTYSALSSGTTGLKPTQIIQITTTPSAHYGLASLTVTGATQIDGGNTYYITGNCTISASFAPKWNIKGGNTDSGSNGDGDAMGDWSTYNQLPFSGTANIYEGSITLAANEAYWFKVVERTGTGSGTSDSYYGYGTNVTNEDQIVLVGQGGSYNLYTGNQHNVVLMSAGSGSYTFRWNSSTKVLQVTYPSVEHPSTDYVYCKKASDWSPVNAHLWGGDFSTIWGHGPSLNSCNFDGTTYYYTAIGDANKLIFGQGPSNDHKTQDLDGSTRGAPTSNKGKFYDASDATFANWNWATFTATLTLDHQGPTNSPAPSSVTVSPNASTNINADIITTTPVKGGYYTFGGYYTEQGGGGTQIIGTDEKIPSNLAGYTSSGNWIKKGSSVSARLYAKWTQTVTLDDNGAYDDDGSLTATYNSAGPFSITTTPRREGYVVEGYYADAECTHKVMTNAGALVDYTGYVSDGKWVHNDATRLYTKWAEDNITVTVNAGDHGEVSTTSVTGHPETVSSSFTVTAAAGYAFSHWTFSEAGKADTNYVSTGGTNNATQTFTLTTKKAITITANYVVRYGLYGSLDADGNPAEGMPGWSVSKDFTYSDGTYTCNTESLTKPNNTYKFRILDRRNNYSWGLSSKAVIGENTATELNSGSADAQLATAGRGSYTFTVVEADEGAHPQVTISNPTSYLVHFGKKCFTIDGDDEGDLGGTVTVSDGTNTYADGSYIAKDETVSIEATAPTGYHFAEWHANSSYNFEFGDKENPHSWTVSEAVNAYAKFVENSTTFEGDVSGHETEWNNTGNWSSGALPTINDVVIIEKPVNVDINTAKAKRVIISNYGDTKTGKLTINSDAALVVAQTVKKTTDGTEYVATEAADLVLESDLSNGTGALITGERSTNTVATVQFATKAKKDGSGKYINQYFGIPFAATTKYSYYGSYLRKFDVSTDSWVALGEDNMYPFSAYRIMREETTGETYVMDGVLRLPGIDEEHKDTTLTLTETARKDNMFANSWTAPIDITQMDGDDFVGTDATIYIFNSGSQSDNSTNGGSTAAKSSLAGQWLAITLEGVKADASDYSISVIPSQQAFLVQTNSESATHTLTLDYKKVVYDPAKASSATIVPTRAPKREQESYVDIMRLYVTGDMSGFSDRVLMYLREDFTNGFDNGWEGRKFAGSAFAPQLYAHSEDGIKSINAVSDAEGTVLGFYSGSEDSHYTFTFGYEGNDIWYLNDLVAQESTLIAEGNTYHFSTTPSTGEAQRFVISHTPIQYVPTGIEGANGEGTTARKQMIDGVLYIIREGRIFDVMGKTVK